MTENKPSIRSVFFISFLGLLMGCSASRDAQVQATADKVEARGIMKKDDYLLVREITDRIAQSGSVSDSDLDFMLSQLNHSTGNTPSYARLRVAAGLALLKQYGPGQKSRIWIAYLPLFKSDDANDQRAAVAIAEAQKNPEGPALVLPLLDSPHENERMAARKYLESEGYRRAD